MDESMPNNSVDWYIDHFNLEMLEEDGMRNSSIENVRQLEYHISELLNEIKANPGIITKPYDTLPAEIIRIVFELEDERERANISNGPPINGNLNNTQDLMAYSCYLTDNGCYMDNTTYPSRIKFCNNYPIVTFQAIDINSNHPENAEYFCYFDICNAYRQSDYFPRFSGYELYNKEGSMQPPICQMERKESNGTYMCNIPKFCVVSNTRVRPYLDVIKSKLDFFCQLDSRSLDGSCVENTADKYEKEADEELYLMVCICQKDAQGKLQRVCGPIYSDKPICRTKMRTKTEQTR